MLLAADVGLPRTSSGRREKTAVRINKLKRPERGEPCAMLWYKTQSENEKAKRNHKASRSREIRLKRKGKRKRKRERKNLRIALDGMIT